MAPCGLHMPAYASRIKFFLLHYSRPWAGQDGGGLCKQVGFQETPNKPGVEERIERGVSFPPPDTASVYEIRVNQEMGVNCLEEGP